MEIQTNKPHIQTNIQDEHQQTVDRQINENKGNKKIDKSEYACKQIPKQAHKQGYTYKQTPGKTQINKTKHTNS